VLPYLRQLAGAGIAVHLLTFEPQARRRWTPERIREQRAALHAEGISWFFLPYHKRPTLPATLYDVAAGAWRAFRLARAQRINVIHARGALPTLMAMLSQRWTRCSLVFDMRGLNAEESVDAGNWSANSPLFRAFKWVERLSLRRATQVVVLTERMRDWIVERRLKGAEQIEVIPCCVDFERFSSRGEEEPAAPGRFEVVYAGSVTGLYLLEEMAQFFLAVRAARPDAFLRIMTAAPAADVAARLRGVGLSTGDFWVGAVRPAEVPAHLRRARLGLSFRKPTFAQIASSPTKIAEYLAAGVPVVSNAGVGDVDDLLTRERVGVLIEEFDAEAYAVTAARALRLATEPDVRSRCVAAARRNFDLVTVGGVRYRNVYRRIGEQHTRSLATSGAAR
ncbi:MAG: glycosyltransferase, partial [Pyrinomonadaceae bacterium]